MGKFFGGVVVGVFLGALAVEVLARTKPEVLNGIEHKARRVADRVGDFVRRSAETIEDYA